MKYLKNIIFAVAIFIASLALFKTNVSADSYSISNFNVIVNIDEYGNADVNQKITYDFDGDYHGVDFVQDLHGTGGAKPINVTTDDSRKIKVKYTNNKNELKIKTYTDISNEKIQFNYHYKIYGVVTNYKDTARINWKVIGKNWDVDLENVKVTFNLPKKNVNDLRAWVHASENGNKIVDTKNGNVTLDMDNNPSNSFVETDMIFPTSVTPKNEKNVDKKMKSEIISEEKNISEENEIVSHHKKVILFSVALALIFISLIIYILILINYRKIKNDPNNTLTPVNHWFEVPEVSPSVAQMIIENKKPDENGFVGDLLVDANRKNIKITENEKDFNVRRLAKIDNNLLGFLFDSVGDGDSFDISDIKKYTKKDNSQKLNKSYKNWQNEIFKEYPKYFNVKHAKIARWSLIGQIVIGVLLLIINFIIPLTFSGIQVIIFRVISVLFMISVVLNLHIKRRNVSIYSDEGVHIVTELRGFRNMLEDIDDIKMAEVGDIILWEQILPYAAAFGVSKKVIKALKLNFELSDISESDLYPIYGYNNIYFVGSFSKSFSSGVTTSSSGGSGGFSGGNSGGFGGGSGGGAF
ncbi:DUF2207 domain-containing protein [Companilactobacillus metriopterae]|uniref:DUF2207 domain-containing protein n=1 Tax=Companilactobacillus metriopterae TaxID=1909267 RepID=UPI00100AC1C5|nr:DUF2207 domain-containing protein [Companilactobacillus metriopterae]